MWNVKQKYSTSCGIACVAMLAEKKHATVLNNAKYTFQERCFGKTTSYTNLDEIKTLLGNFGVSYQKDFKSIDKDIQSQKRFWRNLKGTPSRFRYTSHSTNLETLHKNHRRFHFSTWLWYG